MSASTKNLLALSEAILNQTKPVEEVSPVGVDPIVDDGLKNIEVPDAFVENVLNFSGRLNEGDTTTFEEKPVQYLNEAKMTEERVLSLVEKLQALIKEARDVMTEMTTTGMLGAGSMLGSQPRKFLPKKKRKKGG